MFKLICHSLCAVFIAIAFSVLAAPGTVGLSQPAQDPKKQTKQEREYQKIKQFSEKLYAEDALFREEVDESYRQKRREHSELAYFTNTRDSQDDQDTRTGDKLKVEDALYDNPLVQDYVNRVGQLIVPKDSKKLYGFKVTLNPIPEARALSTGTIYISSGLLSMIDNEAQLAYVLGHEVAHVEKDHWREDVVVERGIHRYYEKQEKKRAILGAVIGMGAGAIVGGSTNSFGKGVKTDVIYDYMQEVGEIDWAARPALNISTKNIDPIGIQGGLTTSAPPPAPAPASVTVTPASVTPEPVRQTPTKQRKP